MAENKKKWYQSKTKIGAILLGTGPILVTLGNLFQGNADLTSTLPSLLTQVGIVWGVFGLRDLPFVNKK